MVKPGHRWPCAQMKWTLLKPVLSYGQVFHLHLIKLISILVPIQFCTVYKVLRCAGNTNGPVQLADLASSGTAPPRTPGATGLKRHRSLQPQKFQIMLPVMMDWCDWSKTLTAEKNPQIIGHRDQHQRQKKFRNKDKLGSDGEYMGRWRLEHRSCEDGLCSLAGGGHSLADLIATF